MSIVVGNLLTRSITFACVLPFHLHSFAPFESNLKTTKSASAKHHPGSEAWREERKKAPRAPCAGRASGSCTDSKNERLRCGAQCLVSASVNCADSEDETPCNAAKSMNTAERGEPKRRLHIQLGVSKTHEVALHRFGIESQKPGKPPL